MAASCANDKEDNALSGGNCEQKIREISVTGGWGERRSQWVGFCRQQQRRKRRGGGRMGVGEHALTGEGGGERGEDDGLGFVVDSKEERGEEEARWGQGEHALTGEGGGERGEDDGLGFVVDSKEERGDEEARWGQGEHALTSEGGGEREEDDGLGSIVGSKEERGEEATEWQKGNTLSQGKEVGREEKRWVGFYRQLQRRKRIGGGQMGEQALAIIGEGGGGFIAVTRVRAQEISVKGVHENAYAKMGANKAF